MIRWMGIVLLVVDSETWKHCFYCNSPELEHEKMSWKCLKDVPKTGIALLATSGYLCLIFIRALRLVLIYGYHAAKEGILFVKFVCCSCPDFLISRVQV